ncbi:MAG TPA: heme-binding protein [Burkholderiales bacterium]
MKDFLYFAQLTLESLVSVFGVRLYEEPRYSVLEARAGVDEAFRALFAYISGAEKVAMTTPVATRSGQGALRMQFFLPARYSAASAPRPQDARIRRRGRRMRASAWSSSRRRRSRCCAFPGAPRPNGSSAIATSS